MINIFIKTKNTISVLHNKSAKISVKKTNMTQKDADFYDNLFQFKKILSASFIIHQRKSASKKQKNMTQKDADFYDKYLLKKYNPRLS